MATSKKPPVASREKKSTAASPAARKPAAPPANAAAIEARAAAEKQLKAWGDAMRLFGARKFPAALAAFETVAAGPVAAMGDKARSYILICQRQVGSNKVEPKTAEEFYNLGITSLNAADPAAARTHLERAAKLQPGADHILYSLAAACALSGDAENACAHLRRAIEIEPRNRVLARQDSDFAEAAVSAPGLRLLIEGPSSGA